jgi:hypothetical protein
VTAITTTIPYFPVRFVPFASGSVLLGARPAFMSREY